MTTKPKTLAARIWDVIWVPIDRSPIEPAALKVSDRAKPLFGYQPAVVPAPAERIPPHRRHIMLSDKERWALYSSFKLPPDEEDVVVPLRIAA